MQRATGLGQSGGKDDLAYIGDPSKGVLEDEPDRQPWNQGMSVSGFFVARRDRMYFCLQTESDPLTVTVYARPDGQGASATMTVRRDGSAEAKNEKGESLKLDAKVRPEDKGFTVRMNLPYTAAKGQGAWGTITEHQRYSIKVGDVLRNFYAVSSAADARGKLERELGQGLRTWQAIFDDLGYVPTGLGEPRWQRFSDTGGYAHLIQAASQWVTYLDGKRDWERHGVPALR